MMLDQALAQQIQNYVPLQKPIKIEQFVLHLADKIYEHTTAYLFDDHIILKINAKKGTPFLRIGFNFDLVFDLERHDDQKNNRPKLGHPHTIRFQRYNQVLSLKNSNIPDEMFEWRDILGKKLNQRGFHQLFKPIKKVGKGNFASVYLVVKHQDNKKYAVKAFSKQGCFSQQRGKQSLINQIQVMRKFSHSNLMQLYQIYQSQNSIYLIVQLLQGGQLYDKIKNKHRFVPSQIKLIMKGILMGLEYMHQRDVMHRDLKPENVLFRKDGDYDCVVADFGLSTDVDVQDYLFVRCGTPGYVAPEIVNLKDLKAKYNPVCDLFSLGVIFHLLLLRKSPFPGRQYDEVLSQNRACKFNFQAAQYKNLPQSALDLLVRLLQKDPSKRISAQSALNHEYFHSEITKPIKNRESRPSALLIQRNLNPTQCESPLMTTKNPIRKQGKLRDDSCLKFKMKENMVLGKTQETGENIEQIDSPAAIKNSRNSRQVQSRFKRMVNEDEK